MATSRCVRHRWQNMHLEGCIFLACLLMKEHDQNSIFLSPVASFSRSSNHVLKRKNWSSQSQFCLSQYGLMQARLSCSGLYWLKISPSMFAKPLFEVSVCTRWASPSGYSCFIGHRVHKHFWLGSSFNTVASENICTTPRSPTRDEYLLKRKFVLKISVTFSNQHFSEVPWK